MPKTSRFTDEQIIRVLQELEAGMRPDDVARQVGVALTTLYRWKAKYGGLEVSEAKRLKSMDEENRRLKRMVADLSLDNQALKDLLSKKW
jgi:putative transposase